MLLKIAMVSASAAGAAVKEADLRALNLPVYDYDIEEAGVPEPVLQFKDMVDHLRRLVEKTMDAAAKQKG